MDRLHAGNVWAALFSHVLTRCCPQMVPVGPIWARLSPACVLRSRTENWPHLGLDRPNCDYKGTFSPFQTPRLVVSTPSKWPKCTARRSFCLPGARFTSVEGVLARACPPKRGPKWVKNVEMPADVPLARFEAYLGRFDRPYVPKGLKGGSCWDQQRVTRGSKMWGFPVLPRELQVH